MIRVLVVDDELLVRITIRTLLNWEKFGYSICGECSDGEQAMNLIPKLHPNIVITDVKMEHVNGDELVRYIDKNYPEICTIVISSYDDYQYVRDTLKHNAVDYLIKNDLTAEVLLESLNRASEILNLGLEIKKSESDRKALCRQFVLQLLGGLYHDKEEQLRSKMKLINIEMGTAQVLPILVSFEHKENKYPENHMQEKLMIDLSTCTMLEHIIVENHQGIAVAIENNLILMLVSFDGIVSQKTIQEDIQKLVQRSDFCLQKFLQQKANFHVGRMTSLRNIDQSYIELCEKRKLMFLEEEEYGFSTGSTKEYNNGQGISLQDEQNLLLAIKNQDKDMLKAVLESIFSVILQEQIPRSGCSQLFNDMIILTFSVCKKYGIEYKRIYDRSVGIMEYVGSIERFKDCRAFIIRLFEDIIDILRQREADKAYSVPVRNAVSYIHKHYRESISLGEVADKLNMNSSYLSTLFKTEVGIGFVDYLNEVRLTHAKELMDGKSMKLKELIEQSGFYSYQYFFSLFKKKYHMTPKEYMEGQI